MFSGHRGRWPSVAPNLADAGSKGLTLLCSVSVNLAELWRAPSKGGEGNFEGVKPRRGSGRGGLRKKGGRFKAAGGRGSSHDFALHVPILLLKKYVFR